MRFGTLWTPRSTNRKTGDIPTCFIGRTRKESLKSCLGCPLLHVKDGGEAESGKPMCNAQYGTQSFGHKAHIRKYAAQVEEAEAAGEEIVDIMSLERALEARAYSAKYVRLAALGEPSKLSYRVLKEIIDTTRGSGLGFLGYTHFWADYGDTRKGRLLRQNFMASCNSLDEIDEALSQGWNATAIVEPGHPGGFQRTPEGSPAILCPHALDDRVQCNQCGLCDPQKNPGTAILFWDMGSTAQGKRRKLREQQQVA